MLLVKEKLAVRVPIWMLMVVALAGDEGEGARVVADATPPMTNRLTIVSATPRRFFATLEWPIRRCLPCPRRGSSDGTEPMTRLPAMSLFHLGPVIECRIQESVGPSGPRKCSFPDHPERSPCAFWLMTSLQESPKVSL